MSAPTCLAARPAGAHPLDPPKLLRSLDTTLGDDEHDPYVVVVPAGDAPTVLVQVPAPTHPVDVLIGWTPPEPLVAVGVVACATATPLEGDDRPGRVRISHLSTGDGGTFSLLRDLSAGTTHDPGPPEGRLVDFCRRVLGLPTAPPTHPFVVFGATLWLDQVLATVAARPDHRCTWTGLARMHPFAPPAPGGTTAFAEAVLSVTGGGVEQWALLRAAVVARRGGFGLTAEQAGWMDDGMFSRWVLAATPDLADLADDLRILLPEARAADLLDVLARWGLL